jgi:Zn-dependent protease with chaperone function
MAEFFDGKSARAQQVRVLLLNKQINIYHEEELISSTPVEACTVQKIGGKLYVYLTADATAFVTMEQDTPTARLIEDEIQSGKTDIFSRLMRIRLPLLLGVIGGIGLAIFLLFTWVIPAVGMRVISVETEQKLGNSAYNSIIATETIDSVKTQEARAFANKMLLSDKYKLHIVVIKEKLVNAFALPGGTIVITTGIIKHMNSPEELAALLGHEVTHVNNRHSLRSMLKNMSVSAATSLVFGNSSSIINGAAYLNQLSYSRGLEAEADKTGIELLRRNHVNPIGMVKLMEDLQAQEKIQPVGFLSTHPLTKERIKAAKKVIQQLPAADYPPREDLEQIWKQLKQ